MTSNEITKIMLCLLAVFFLMSVQNIFAELDTLPPLNDDKVPQNFDQLWADFDPRAEPLDTEILKQWEEDGVVLQVLRYRVGIFKGQKAMMAAVYGYPKGALKLPGLVQIHGGGQYADYRAVLTNARRGYATISISWAGRINAPDYVVNPNVVKLFWDDKKADPEYRITTDWGALDGYHAPCRNPENNFVGIAPGSWTLDQVESPRNGSWYICTMAARRALTFLERQRQVDPDRLGVYGHSMGGKLTVLTAGSDSRVKAAAPSCGGLSNRNTKNQHFNNTLADDVYLKRISCPIIFLSPSNDFHGRIDDLQTAIKEIKSDDWRLTCSAHHNHQDTGEYQVAGLLWFDQYLKGDFTYPQTPKSSLQLNTADQKPLFTVTPDMSKPVLSVDIYYTQQGRQPGEKYDREHTMNRFWHYAKTKQDGNIWTADLPLHSTDKPLWVYANVVYKIDEPVTGAGYYYAYYTADKVNLSSEMHIISPQQLKASSAKASLKPTLLIEAFEDDWQKSWFTYEPQKWARKTHKIYDDKWKAPVGAKLAFEVQSDSSNKLVVTIDNYAAEVGLTGGSDWQRVVLSASDFKDALGEAMKDFDGKKRLSLTERKTLRKRLDGKDNTLKLGAPWVGEKPVFNNLRWLEDSRSSG